MTCALLIGQLVVVCLPHQSHGVREVAVLRQDDLCRPGAAMTSVPHVPSESFLLMESFNQDVQNGSDETGALPCRTQPATEATETARKGNAGRDSSWASPALHQALPLRVILERLLEDAEFPGDDRNRSASVSYQLHGLVLVIRREFPTFASHDEHSLFRGVHQSGSRPH